MNLQEWLQRVGFVRNPFALKQADDEGEQLNEYFVAHPSYSAIIDSSTYRSSILHALRGTGKSSLRRMFEQHCQRPTAEPPSLVVPLTDWMPISARSEEHFHELARRVVVALAQSEHTSWHAADRDEMISAQMAWLCLAYGDYLSPAERQRLAAHGCLPKDFDDSLYTLDRLPVARRMRLLANLICGLGFRGCYVLIDGIDELIETAADWAAGANLIEALLANLAIVEASQISFKFFIPSEVVRELQGRCRLRYDRLQVLAVRWDDRLLHELLSRRLQAFSDGLISRMAQLSASPVSGDISDCPRGSRLAAGVAQPW